jgi:hypothetical protein
MIANRDAMPGSLQRMVRPLAFVCVEHKTK